jgi:predicted nuclease with TOPRIM domain
MPLFEIFLKFILPFITIGISLFASLLGHNFKSFIKKHDKLSDEFDHLKDSYHQTREQLIRLEAEAVTRGELKDMFKEFESRLESKFDSLDSKMNSRMEALKELLTERVNNTSRRWNDNG